MKNILMTIRRYQLLQALIYVLMGIFLMTNPKLFFKSVIYLLSAYFLILGGIGLYQQRNEENDEKSFFPLTFLILGIAVLIFASPIVKIANIILGLFILMNGIGKVTDGYRIKKVIINEGLPLIVYGIILAIVGLVILFNPFSTWLFTIKFIGIMLFVMGIMDVIGYFRYRNTL